ncbi:hypothetical protein ABPG72_001119, partial [Tetrahymena utriculariae]
MNHTNTFLKKKIMNSIKIFNKLKKNQANKNIQINKTKSLLKWVTVKKIIQRIPLLKLHLILNTKIQQNNQNTMITRQHMILICRIQIQKKNFYILHHFIQNRQNLSIIERKSFKLKVNLKSKTLLVHQKTKKICQTKIINLNMQTKTKILIKIFKIIQQFRQKIKMILNKNKQIQKCMREKRTLPISKIKI